MIVTYKQLKQIFKGVREQVDEEARLLQNKPADSERQLLLRTRYIEGMQQTLIFLSKTLNKW